MAAGGGNEEEGIGATALVDHALGLAPLTGGLGLLPYSNGVHDGLGDQAPIGQVRVVGEWGY